MNKQERITGKDGKLFKRLMILLFAASFVFALFFVYDIVLQAMENGEDDTSPSEEITSSRTPDENIVTRPPMKLYVSDKVSFLAHLTVDGKDYTYPFNVGDNATVQTLLDRAGVKLSDTDYINKYDRDTVLFEDIYVEIGRVTYEYVTETVTIPYETEVIPVSYRLYRLAYGGYYDSDSRKTYSERAGENGVKTITTRVKYVDGVKVGQTKVSEKITKQPVSARVYEDINYKFDRGNGAPTQYLEMYKDIQVTSYYSTSVGGQTTTSGKACQIGRVAADLSRYPIGTKLYIILPDGFVYGYCTVEDKGGAVKGNIIDLFFDSKADSVGRLGCTGDTSTCRNCKNYGTCDEFCTVYVIEWGKDKNGNELPHR
ncbi:MAG: 3D domain-containing protein [Eubacteriales bacterium]